MKETKMLRILLFIGFLALGLPALGQHSVGAVHTIKKRGGKLSLADLADFDKTGKVSCLIIRQGSFPVYITSEEVIRSFRSDRPDILSLSAEKLIAVKKPGFVQAKINGGSYPIYINLEAVLLRGTAQDIATGHADSVERNKIIIISNDDLDKHIGVSAGMFIASWWRVLSPSGEEKTFSDNEGVFSFPIRELLGRGTNFYLEVDDGLGNYDPSSSHLYGVTSLSFEIVDERPKTLASPKNFKLEKAYQRDAIISWTAGGSEKEWELSYGDLKLIVTEPKATLRGLDPNTDYTIEVRAKIGEKLSEPLKGSLKTGKFSEKHNLIPHIYGMKEFFSQGEILPIFWKDMQKLPKKISYSLSPLSTSEEKATKIFSPLPEAISFSEKGSFILTLRFEGHDKFEEIEYLLEVK